MAPAPTNPTNTKQGEVRDGSRIVNCFDCWRDSSAVVSIAAICCGSEPGNGLGSAGLVAALTGVGGSHRALAAAALDRLQDAPGAGTPGGTLRVATIGEPPTLDEHQTTAEITAVIGYCMYEGLFTFESGYQPIPELAETHTISEDGLVSHAHPAPRCPLPQRGDHDRR